MASQPPFDEMATEAQTQDIIEDQSSNRSTKRRKNRPDFYKVKPVRRRVIPKVLPTTETPKTPAPSESPPKSKSSKGNEQKHTEAPAES